MNRRDFLKLNAKGAILLLMQAAGVLKLEQGIAASTPELAKVKGPAVAATRAAVELLGGIKTFVKPGDRVVIKPNMSFNRTPDQASNTSPEVVKTVVAMCNEAKASKILVLDHTLDSPRQCLERSGILPAVNSVEKDLVYNVNNSNLYREVTIRNAENLAQTQVPREVLKSDVLISVPTAKSHSATGVSLSMKGMMGLIWDRWILHRQNLDTGIVDICSVLKADLTIIDGSRVLSTNGPQGPGKVLKENTIIASKDMVAADACAVESFTWYGQKLKARQVAHIREAHGRKFGRMDWQNLNIQTLEL